MGFSSVSNFTQQTVKTVAVADAFLSFGGDKKENLPDAIKKSVQYWSEKYPMPFPELKSEEYPEEGLGGKLPYWPDYCHSSMDYISLINISAAFWSYNSLSETQDIAKTISTGRYNAYEKSKDKALSAFATTVFLARSGRSMKSIKACIEKMFGYDLSDRRCEDGTMDELITVFVNSKSFADAFEKAVFIHLEQPEIHAAIVGAMAEAFYGVPNGLIKRCRKFLPEDLVAVIDKFNEKIFGNLAAQYQLEEVNKTDKVIVNDVDETDSRKRTALYGAIIGDMVGSRFEFAEVRQKSKDFELFTAEDKFTDDTVMTVAVADAVLKAVHEEDGRIFRKAVEDSLQSWGRKYPHAGYGKRFKEWIFSVKPTPYNSLGNGSAMRVSAAAWISNSMFDARENARVTARVTHNHFEGVKGAMAVASAIFLARQGKSKEEIKNYIESEFDYDLSRSLDDVRNPISVPEAIIAFLESTDFVDAIRNAVSLGGDSDTQAAIAGSIAEAFYCIPVHLITKCREYLPSDMLEVVDRFNLTVGWFGTDAKNQSAENKIINYQKNPTEKNLQGVKDELLDMLKKDIANEGMIGFYEIMLVTTDDGREGWTPDYVEKNGNSYQVFYTNVQEVGKRKIVGNDFVLTVNPIKEAMRVFKQFCLNDGTNDGWVLNPYSDNPFFIEKNFLKDFLEKIENEFPPFNEYCDEFDKELEVINND